MHDKIWANSADSLWVEPPDLWREGLPAALAERMPRSVKDADGRAETIYVDGQAIRRPMPTPNQEKLYAASNRPKGSADLAARLADNDEEGVWAELVFPSLGIWNATFRDPELLREALRVSNDYAKAEIQDRSPRLLATAQVSLLDIDDGVTEMRRPPAWVSRRCS